MLAPEEIEKEARKSDTPPTNYLFPEFYLFLILKEVYKQYHNKSITQEQGSTLKRLAFKKYTELESDYRLYQALHKEFTESVKSSERLRSQLRLEIKEKNVNVLDTAFKLISLYAKEEFNIGT